jgi:HAD superfamily hydrolase (TIGR01509 family)
VTTEQYRTEVESKIRAGDLKAVIFDIDGTLYRQAPLRRAMLLRLLASAAAHPRRGVQTLRVLRAYRRAQETLRSGAVAEGVAAAQIRLACEEATVDSETVVQCVKRWMDEEPLALLRQCVQPGALELLRRCRAEGLRLAALSDYPAEAKLGAMGMNDLFDLVLCAQVPEVDVFKPHPRGLLVIVERLGVSAAECLYVGDRADVDAPTADAAGMSCVILTRRPARDHPRTYLPVASHRHLQEILWPPAVRA